MFSIAELYKRAQLRDRRKAEILLFELGLNHGSQICTFSQALPVLTYNISLPQRVPLCTMCMKCSDFRLTDRCDQQCCSV